MKRTVDEYRAYRRENGESIPGDPVMLNALHMISEAKDPDNDLEERMKLREYLLDHAFIKGINQLPITVAEQLEALHVHHGIGIALDKLLDNWKEVYALYESQGTLLHAFVQTHKKAKGLVPSSCSVRYPYVLTYNTGRIAHFLLASDGRKLEGIESAQTAYRIFV